MSFAARTLNHALAREPWARTRLAAHAGTTFAVIAGPVRTSFVVEPDGTLAEGVAAPSLTLRVSPWNVPTLLAQPARWSEFVTAEGDASLAATLAELALTLPWFVERELARAFGPIVGTRVADAGRALLAMPAYAAGRLGDSAARYVGDEGKLVVTRPEAREFAADASALDARVDALAQRLERLEGKKGES